MSIFQRDLEAVSTFPRSSLIRLLRYTHDDQLYEAVRHELLQRDTGRLVNHYVGILTGDRVTVQKASTHVYQNV
jgi:hypothetical protein